MAVLSHELGPRSPEVAVGNPASQACQHAELGRIQRFMRLLLWAPLVLIRKVLRARVRIFIALGGGLVRRVPGTAGFASIIPGESAYTMDAEGPEQRRLTSTPKDNYIHTPRSGRQTPNAPFTDALPAATSSVDPL